MSDEKVPTEIVEVTSLEHLREQFFAAVDRVEDGEPVDIVLYDPRGVGTGIIWGNMTAAGLGKALQEDAPPARDRALPYPVGAGV